MYLIPIAFLSNLVLKQHTIKSSLKFLSKVQRIKSFDVNFVTCVPRGDDNLRHLLNNFYFKNFKSPTGFILFQTNIKMCVFIQIV